MRRHWAWLAVVAVVLASCNQKGPSGNAAALANQPKKQLNVDADPGIEHVMSHQKDIFEFQHDSIKLNISYKNETEMLEDFRTGKADVLVMARQLDSLEKERFINHDTLYVRELQVAYDAVALIGNKTFSDTTLDIEKLKRYFSPANNDANAPLMVFTDKQSSVVKFVLDKLGYKEKISPKVYALKSTNEVIEYVKKDKNAIGFVPFNYLSDLNDNRVKTIYDSVKILSLRSKDPDGRYIRVSANQVDIVTGDYPLRRNICTVMRYEYDNLDWEFVDFLYKPRGARIFMMDGLIPVHIPPLDIDVNTDGGFKSNN